MKRKRLEDPAPTCAVDLFLDSGVFSAWAKELSIDIRKYCKFVERNKQYLSCYATMDVIPGKFGEKRTQEQVEASAKGSYANQQFMRGRGLTPIPIFHQGESFSWLERYMNDGETYIGISTAKDLRNTEQRAWLDHVFTMLTDSNGVPFVKTHGFGITNIALLLRYPWFTADSTTWSLAAGYGLVYVPGMGKVPDYSQLPIRIIMSGVHQKAWSSAGRQYEALNSLERRWVDKWLAHVGITHQEARYLSASRRMACLRYFVEFSQYYNVAPFRHREGPMIGFDTPTASRKWAKTAKLWSHMRIIMATMMHNGQFSMILNKAGARDRLVSYWEIMNRDEEALHKFVQLGITDPNYKPRDLGANWDETHMSRRRMKLLERIENYGTSEID